MFFYNPKSGVRFTEVDSPDSVHTFEDFGIVYISHNPSAPLPKTEFIDIPYRDGSIDLTEVNGKEFIRYQDRTLTISLAEIDYADKFDSRISRLQSAILGQRKRIFLDSDPGYYYLGRIMSFSDVTREGKAGRFDVVCQVEPFRYAIQTSSEDWMWDIFNFETGVITQGNRIAVSGTSTHTFYVGDRAVIPSFSVSGSVTMTLRGQRFTLSSGKNTNITFYPGANTVTLSGSGTVTVDYRRRVF